MKNGKRNLGSDRSPLPRLKPAIKYGLGERSLSLLSHVLLIQPNADGQNCDIVYANPHHTSAGRKEQGAHWHFTLPTAETNLFVAESEKDPYIPQNVLDEIIRRQNIHEHAWPRRKPLTELRIVHIPTVIPNANDFTGHYQIVRLINSATPISIPQSSK